MYPEYFNIEQNGNPSEYHIILANCKNEWNVEERKCIDISHKPCMS